MAQKCPAWSLGYLVIGARIKRGDLLRQAFHAAPLFPPPLPHHRQSITRVQRYPSQHLCACSPSVPCLKHSSQSPLRSQPRDWPCLFSAISAPELLRPLTVVPCRALPQMVRELYPLPPEAGSTPAPMRQVSFQYPPGAVTPT